MIQFLFSFIELDNPICECVRECVRVYTRAIVTGGMPCQVLTIYTFSS